MTRRGPTWLLAMLCAAALFGLGALVACPSGGSHGAKKPVRVNKATRRRHKRHRHHKRRRRTQTKRHPSHIHPHGPHPHPPGAHHHHKHPHPHLAGQNGHHHPY